MARYRATENESIAALFTRGNADPDGLSQAEWAIFENRLVPYFQVHLMFYNAVQEGFAGPEILEFVDQDLRDNWGCTKGARRYWAEYQHLYPHRDHVNALFGNRDQA